MSTPIYEFTSHIAGKNAKVAVFEDHLEWKKTGSAAARATKAGMTFGLSLLGGKKEETEVIPFRQVTNVGTKKDGLLNSIVNVTTAGGAVGFRVSHAEAKTVRDLILSRI